MTPEILSLTLEHLFIVTAATTAAFAIALPAGIAAARRPALSRWLLAFANIAQTVPSLALLGFLLVVPVIGGIGKRPAITALILYALLPILRNTVTGIHNIDPAVRESAVAMGMTPSQLLRLVELPLAAPTILAGLRIATVATIGTATIAAAIGGGGLGVLIFRGLASVNPSDILAGAIPAAILAILADGGLAWLAKRSSHYSS
jgi:osmoprotectant transport system permease protein